MYTVTHSIGRGFNDSSYEHQIIKSFADEVLKSSGKFIKELLEEFQIYQNQQNLKFQSKTDNIYQILLLGTLWRIYYNKSTTIRKKHSYWRIFQKSEKRIDDSRNEYSNYNQENLNELFNYLESIKEFKQELNQLKILEKFLNNQLSHKVFKFLRDAIIFADWFKTSCKYTIGESNTNKIKLLYYIRLMGIEINNRKQDN